MRIEQLRSFLLVGWILTVCLVVVAYLYAYFGTPYKPSAAGWLTSFATVIGLLAPHLTVAYDFVLSKRRRTTALIPRQTAVPLLAMCIAYWALLIVLVWLGIAFRVLTIRNGTGIEATTAIVVAVAGALSFLVVRPTTKLFTSV